MWMGKRSAFSLLCTVRMACLRLLGIRVSITFQKSDLVSQSEIKKVVSLGYDIASGPEEKIIWKIFKTRIETGLKTGQFHVLWTPLLQYDTQQCHQLVHSACWGLCDTLQLPYKQLEPNLSYLCGHWGCEWCHQRVGLLDVLEEHWSETWASWYQEMSQ